MTRQRSINIGLLVIRLGIGAMFILAHGLPKLLGGPARWKAVGGAMSTLGISFAPTLWGFAAAMAEFGGGVLLIFGLFTRFASTAMAFTMLVATLQHLAGGETLLQSSHPIEVGVTLLGLAFLGAGAYSLDRRIGKA